MKEKIKLFRESIGLVWKSAPGWAFANTMMSVIRSAFPLLLIWLIRVVIDDITRAAQNGAATATGVVMMPVLVLAIVWFLDEVSSDFSNYVRKKQALKLETYMYGLIHEKSVSLDLINFERPEYYDCLSRASREAPWRPNSILNNIVSMLRGLLSLLLMAGVIFTFRWWLAVILILANIPGIWLRLHYANVLYNFRREQTPEARKSAYFNWLLTGDRPSRELRLFGLGDYFRDLFRKSFLKQKEQEVEIIRKRTMIELVSNLFKAGALLITFIYISDASIGGRISLGQLAMYLVAFRQGMVYIKDLFVSMAGLYEDSLFIGDTFEFLNLEEKIKALEPVKEITTFKDSIVAAKISFTYPGNTFSSINNISLEIKKGEILALVGPNGAGKSTLARLLCRLYDPDSGTLMTDNTDIRHFDPPEYRKMFSVIFQDFMLYNLSVGENIRMGDIKNGNPSGRIRETAATTGIHELIESFPKSYETVIGNLFDDSRELSWGEWQKIALARALFRAAPVLILDEPSSALDAETEYDIFNRFREIVKGRTSILISHRFTNVSLADRIIVLDKGTVAETGTHEELMSKGGIYYTMYSKQAGRFDK
ncbi:MAG TPA: ABC transporter ATP-binding protein [Bacteroidales bacterium]|nr:ABC transporter ATP-binding protein [Bacteroidales bacterium]